MIRKLLFKLSGSLPCRLINLDNKPYLERYYVGQLFGVMFYLHRFVSPDSERHVHNHPWCWGRALILAGSYIEERAIDLSPRASESGAVTYERRVRFWNKVNGNTFHRVKNAAPETWTLFIHGKRDDVKGWGFLESMGDLGTMFRPYWSAPFRWWDEAPTGNEMPRQEFRQ